MNLDKLETDHTSLLMRLLVGDTYMVDLCNNLGLYMVLLVDPLVVAVELEQGPL